ncbi:Kinesin-like protein costa [Frankliniella fusca]|uniref:Kinesin-like protein costa n=1 Tax=Frankliniella fusca TaxID=407009 RepID=A0AAE1LT66_9NEOP|nr:Kinesin-like protein costa [Frankliniella fusca]
MGDMSSMGESQSSAQVLVAGRVRPLIASDRSNGMVCAQAVPQAQQIILGNKCFQFPVDYAFPMESSQSQVFETAVQPLMERLLQGFDTSVITYGHPTSGKTYTMLGPGVTYNISETEYGIIPRATRYIFSRMRQGPPKKFQVKVSFINIQNEVLRDLLTSSQYQQELALVESDAGYPVITGLQEIECETIEVLYNCLHVGMENRQQEWNNARQAGRPAQAHSVFTLSLEQQWITPEGTMEQRLSIARFTDLASSEKIYLRGMGGHVMGETVHMDPGLIAIGKVIQSISQPSEWMCYDTAKEIYRQSTLTRVLKESFGGRSYSLVICCISPALPSFDESLVTLQLAVKLSQIRNSPVMNALSVKVNNVSHDALKQNGTSHPSEEEGAGDTFGLEFATSQWIKLVDSAEGLFIKLVRSSTLSRQERDDIEKWLCLKHECEDCVGNEDEDAASVKGNDGRLLEKIDEVTETEEKTDSSKEVEYLTEDREDKTKYDSETESETESDSQKPDFIEKLDKYIKQFKEKTDKDVNSKQETYRDNCDSLDNEKQDNPTDCVTQHPIRNCLPNNGRRRSIHPGTPFPLMVIGYKPSPILDTANITAVSEDIEGEKTDNIHDQSDDFALEFTEKTEHYGNQEFNKQENMDPHQQLKLLQAGNEAKQNQVKKVKIDIEGIQKRIKELNATILEKEQFIQDIHNNADTRASAKQRFLEQKSKLEEGYCKICSQIAQIEIELYKTASDSEENTKCKKEKDKYERKAKRYQNRLKSMYIIKQIAGESAKKVVELEKSLQSSKRLMEKLTQRLKREEIQKATVEEKIIVEQEKIKELQEICNSQANKNEVINNPSVGNDEDSQWIKEEEDKQMNMRESSQRLQEHLLQRDAFIKEKNSLEKQRARNFLEVSARISHLDQVLKSKSTDLEKLEDEDEREALRLEIHNLRSTRDCLIEQRCALDDKFQKEKSLSTIEERKLLEYDEAIEAIDAVIEYKNELICGRKGGFEAGGREKGEELLMARLNKLSDMEMRMLLYKYFQKVIDLRESGRKLEVQLTEKEVQTDQQTWQIQILNQRFQQFQLEAERQIILLQRQHQEKLHLMLRTFAEESSGGGGASSGTDTLGNQNARIDKEEQTSLRAENRRLYRRLQDLESTLQKLQGRKTNTTEQVSHPRCRSPSPEPVQPPPEPIPNKSMKQLRAAATALTTKVTRQKNKLIIQQQKPPNTTTKKPAHN